MLFHRVLALAATKLIGRVTQMGLGMDNDMENKMETYGMETYDDDDMFMTILDGMNLEECGIDLHSAPALGPDPTELLNQVKLSSPCNQEQTQTIRNKLEAFETCSGYDPLELEEDLFSSLIGALIRCGSAVTMSDIENLHVPEVCMEAVFGNNPLGQFIRDVFFHPSSTSKCIHALGENIPQCSLDLWPIPVDGKAIRQSACINEKLEKLLGDTCVESLHALSCLPEKPSASMCDQYAQDCADSASLLGVLFILPSGMRGMPLPDACQRAAGKEDLVQRYEAYRETCAPADTELWKRLEDSSSQPFEMTTFYEFMHPGGEKEDKTSLENEPTIGLVYKQTEDGTSSDPKPAGGSFGYGVLTGLVLAGVAYAATLFVLRKRETPKFSTPGQLELSETDGSGYEYSDGVST